MTDTLSNARLEGHYWTRFGTGENWDVMYWRDGYFWGSADDGYLPSSFGEIGPQVFPPNSLRAAPTPDAHSEVGVKLGRFDHHPDPAIDFEIEVQSLEARLFDAKGGISKPGTEPEQVAVVFNDIMRAMTFRVGGDPSAVLAKQALRELEVEAKAALTAGVVKTEPVAAGVVVTDGVGWVFWNPDSGEEYYPDHPVQSGVCEDAERIRKSTTQEDVLYAAMQKYFALTVEPHTEQQVTRKRRRVRKGRAS